MEKILIIDDEKGIRDMVSFALAREDYEIVTASNGKEGLEKILEKGIDIVITDIKMPEMDGMEVLAKIKQIKPEVEVIVATGFGTMDTAVQSLRKGAFDYIYKPFDIDELSVLVSRAIESKHLKAQLVSLKELDRLKDGFFSEVTHELKTPLMAISSALEMILMNDEPNRAESTKKFLEIAKRNAEKIRIIINDYLDSAKMEEGFWDLKKRETSISEMLQATISEIKPIALKKSIDIFQNANLSGQPVSSQDFTLNCDPDLIKRVVTNLLSNAIKYTQESGKIGVRFEKSGPMAKIVVEDNGKGLSEDNLKKVFDRFFRVDPSLSKEQGGFGLGLSICAKIVELHRGKIWAESEGPGRGSRFIVTLPLIEDNSKG